MKIQTAASTPRSAGITLTEILISILILGVGLVSLATLFPIGLLRLREAQRQSRSAYLYESAAADVAARGLFSTNSFVSADLLNPAAGFPVWYPNAASPTIPAGFNPLVQDAAYYALGYDPTTGVTSGSEGGYGLPFAYDPLWRWQTDHANGGIYLFDASNPDYPNGTPEARFAAGDALRALAGNDPYDPINGPPSTYGLQRLTNFNRPAYTNTAGTFIP